jgi:hypothetical protein
MSAAQNIHRLEQILASPFWQDDARRCVMEKTTLEITGRGSAYHWRMYDADEDSYAKSKVPLASLQAAKADMLRALKEGLRRYQEQSASTRS